jgi:hypothetical protein
MKSLKRFVGLVALALTMTVTCLTPASADIRQETLTVHYLAS